MNSNYGVIPNNGITSPFYTPASYNNYNAFSNPYNFTYPNTFGSYNTSYTPAQTQTTPTPIEVGAGITYTPEAISSLGSFLDSTKNFFSNIGDSISSAANSGGQGTIFGLNYLDAGKLGLDALMGISNYIQNNKLIDFQKDMMTKNYNLSRNNYNNNLDLMKSRIDEMYRAKSAFETGNTNTYNDRAQSIKNKLQYA